ncbi:MAG TPA: hypothetical protein VFO58_19775 [Vicinamibacterales bacterium]|nr:hypothetical protein [Vicinamibacterales bacterium]
MALTVLKVEVLPPRSHLLRDLKPGNILITASGVQLPSRLWKRYGQQALGA